jgi:hypothetical protein
MAGWVPMARFSGRRIFSARRIVVAAAAVVVAGAAVGGGVAVALAGGGHGSAASPSADGSVATAAVVRTDLISTVQEGGSIGYGGSYTIAAPSGASASQVSQQEQAVSQDQQQLSADEQAESDAAATGSQAVAADKANVSTDQSTLSMDQATEAKDCAGTGGSAESFADAPAPTASPPTPTPAPTGSGGSTGGTAGSACSQDEQKVSADQVQLTQARQQLAAAQTMAKSNDDQARAKVAADQVKLNGDQATLAQLRAAAVNPGTTYTWLPAVGQVIRQDQPVYSVSGEPVPLLYGAIPAYRAFASGMSDGGDVGELTHDLIALGYGDGLTQSDHYSQATAAAVERWQKKRGLPVTGQILLGEVVFEPGPIRVTTVTPSPGAPVGGGDGGSGGGGGGTVLTATGTTPVVTVDLPVTQEYLVKPGDAVSVVLPDGTTTADGRVESVGDVAICPGGGGTGTGTGSSSSGGSADQSPCSSAGSGGSAGSNSSPTVTVTIGLDGAPPGASLDQAPVNVNITAQSADNVLAAPVNALLALASGGFGVDVVTGSGAVKLTGVTTGLYSSTLVQVSGPGITVGTRVEVPSS